MSDDTISNQEIGMALGHLKQASESLRLASHFLHRDPDLVNRMIRVHTHLRDEVKEIVEVRQRLFPPTTEPPQPPKAP